MRRHGFLDQRRQRHVVERRARGGKLGDLGQNIAAALRLLAQGLEIGGEVVVVVHGLFKLARNQKGRRQRRAEFVGGRRCKAVDLGQMLLARQHQLGRRQRVGKLAGLLGDLERVERGDADCEQDREPDPEQIDRRQHQRIVAVPRQRQMEEHQRRGAGNREYAKRDRQPDRQGGCRNQNRGEKQK